MVTDLLIWRSPKIGVPLNHPFIIFHYNIDHQVWGSPIYGTPHIFIKYFLLDARIPVGTSRQVTGATRVLAMGGGGVSLKEAELSESHQDSFGDRFVPFLGELSHPNAILFEKVTWGHNIKLPC